MPWDLFHAFITAMCCRNANKALFYKIIYFPYIIWKIFRHVCSTYWLHLTCGFSTCMEYILNPFSPPSPLLSYFLQVLASISICRSCIFIFFFNFFHFSFFCIQTSCPCSPILLKKNLLTFCFPYLSIISLSFHPSCALSHFSYKKNHVILELAYLINFT